MREHAGYGAAISRLPAGRLEPDQAALYKQSHALAIDIDEWEYLAVADVSPAERAGITPFGPQILGIALAF